MQEKKGGEDGLPVGRRRVLGTIFLAWPGAALREDPCLVPSSLGKQQSRPRDMGSRSRWSTEPVITEGQFMPTRGSRPQTVTRICHLQHGSDPQSLRFQLRVA